MFKFYFYFALYIIAIVLMVIFIGFIWTTAIIFAVSIATIIYAIRTAEDVPEELEDLF